MPAGYAEPDFADYSAPDTRIVQYLPRDAGMRFGSRISVQSSTQSVQELTAHYEVLGTAAVRGGKSATHFRIGQGPGARHALVWEEARVRLAVYAFADLRQLRQLRQLAEQLERCAPAGC